jgi:hypothetical protein
MTTLFKNLRPLLLSVLIFALVAGGTPVTLETFAKWGRPSISRRKKTKRYRRHSRAWWRRHRARLRAKRERAERRRLERQNSPSAQNSSTGTAGGSTKRPVNQSGANSALAVSAPRLPFDLQLPHTWGAARRGADGAVTFAVRTPDGRAAGTAVLMPFGAARPEAAGAISPRTKTVGGTSINALRRTVIDRMVAEGGWVVNDMVREMGGRRVFVVIAQTGTPGAPTKSLTFYFAEVDGRLYTLATTAPVEFAEPIAAGSEQVMATLRTAGAPHVAAQQ